MALVFPFLLGLLLAGSPAVAEDAPPFERRDLRTAHPIVQDTVSLRLGEGTGRHLLVVTSPDDEQVEVLLYPPDADGAPGTVRTRIELPSDVVAFDAADLDEEGHQALYFLTPHTALRFEPSDGSLREIARVQSIYRRPVPGRLLAIDFMRGSGGRRSPLLVLPDFDGVRAGSSLLPIAPRTSHDAGPTYRPADVQLADLDLDGTDDVFLISEDALHIFHGTGSGFADVAVVRPLGLGVGRELRDDRLGNVDQSDVTTRRVIAIEDFDSDGLVDLLIESARRTGVLERETSHELYLGRRGPQGLSYATTPTTTILGDAPLGGVRTIDIDGDDRLDLTAGSIDVGIGTIVSALLTGTVDFDVRFFRLGEDGYPEEPDETRDAQIEFDLSEGSASIPVLALADIDGDGGQDLIVREDDDVLQVYRYDGSPELFSDDAQEMKVPLPQNGQLVRRADLNGDDRDDLILRYEGLDGEGARRRLTLLLGRRPPSAARRPGA